MLVDVHCHLTHKQYSEDLLAVIERANQAEVAIVVNGLETQSNREILKMAATHKNILPALGIYPLEALTGMPLDLPFEISNFDLEAEIAFIREQAQAGTIVAVGECGLDGYWVGEETFAKQEEVFLRLLEIASEADIPVIIHSRKREKRVIEILEHHGQKRVDFHCYCGKSKWAISAAEKHGWHFSIPANARKSESFTKLLKSLPPTSILLETDSPYLSPVRGDRNEPANIVGTAKYLGELREMSEAEVEALLWQNFTSLFESNLITKLER
ncbi:MAG: TatD family hydrolase [Pseudobacteriovorax sp.]|nr:TatD family hydrolase [Pseudobacteriovorax sp.]